MTTVVAVGFPHEAMASAAAEDVQLLACDVVLTADAVAVVSRDRRGVFHVTTNHHAVVSGGTWGVFWLLLFAVLFFVPLLGMRVGTSLGALIRKIERSGIDESFQTRVRELLRPGTSLLFLAVDPAVSTYKLGALERLEGTVVSSALSPDAESEIQRALHGGQVPYGMRVVRAG